MRKVNILFTAVVFVAFSCIKDDTQFLSFDEQLELDAQIINDYLSTNNLSAESTVDGLRYEITDPGNGSLPAIGTTVVVNYTGKLLNGSVFDSNTTGSFSFALGQGRVIQGWDIGIALLSKGGKATLYIPSGLAYGNRGAGGIIGPNEVLIFDVELVDF